MSQSRRGHKNVNVDAGGSSVPPSVPTIQRRSNSFQNDDDAIIMAQARQQHNATDEFGFPLQTQQLRTSVVPPNHVHYAPQNIDLEKVTRPSRLQQQQQSRGQPSASTQQQQQNDGSIQQYYSQHTPIGTQSYLPPPQPTRPSTSMSRNNSNSASSIQKVPSKLSASSSSLRPPRSHTTLSRQISNQSTMSSSKNNKKPKRAPRIKISKPDPTKYKNYTFQHPVNAMRVTIRTVDLSHRIAFDTRIPTSASSASLQRMLEEMDRVRGSRSTFGSVIDDASKSKRSDNPCRISPSPNHMAILEFMHGSRGLQSLIGVDGRRVVRQLQWNVACSVDADPWFDGKYEEDEQTTNSIEQGMKNVSMDGSSDKKTLRPMRRKPKSSHGDGRYIPIDPLATTKSMLPNHSPLLTNAKRRLPMRADVGFSNPTKEEIAKKMEEVKMEAEWEEASPRIVLLFSAFSLFEDEEEMDELHSSCRADAKLWAGGSIPGIPFAGRDLVTACKMSARFDKKKDELERKNQGSTDFDRCKDPRSYSVFAPPVDATFSSTQLWRPRPFMDRPPGFVYFLACPLDVRFESGDVEPFFCTMAVYSLPKQASKLEEDGGDNSNATTNFCGKISEDFFFPAGDWNGIDGVEVAFDEEEDDEQPPQSWRRRKRRAIMSYDPLEVSPNDLHLVIQAFRVIRPNENEAPINNAPATTETKKTIGSKMKRNLLSGKSKRNYAATIESVARTTMHQSASLSNDDPRINEVGAQYLIPVSFSITPVFHENTTQQKQESASFFAFPDVPESHDDFVIRLASLTNPQSSTNKAKPTPIIGGYTDVFTSCLGMDFTRALLDEPPQLHNLLDDAAPLGPQLLADVMGDCAISFDGPTSEGAKKQRSKLRRLPPSRESGYASSFDLKEVLYFPPRSLPRKYEDDTGLCSSTVLNLLYIYPRLIRWKSSGSKNSTQISDHLSIRIQLVEQELPPEQQSFDSSDPTYQALVAVYNPSSPAGPPLIESFFTKLVKRQIDDKRDSKTKSGRKEIPLKDEVKLRLPDILDRRHFLQFSLLSVRGDTDIELIAETTIPFIISSKESTTGGRVTTIIPNGLHRIQLSEGIQIHLETRLASSTHISDPSVATLLRDYPLISSAAKSSGTAGGDMDSISSASDVIVHASSGFPFLDILTMASGQAVKRHFLPLATAYMLTFFNQNCPSFYFESLFDVFGSDTWRRLVAWEKTDSLLAIIRSLFEILDKTRTSYQERERSMLSLQYQRLVKSFLDGFDEPLFTTHRHSGIEMQHSENGDSIGERHFNESIDSSHAFNEDAYNDEHSSALKESKDDLKRMPKYKITSPKNAIEEKRSFSRKAFVATRSEQMKAEAELNDSDAYGEYIDDDQTVVTLGTITSRMDSGSVFPVIFEAKSFVTVGNQDDILRTSTFGMQEETSKGWTCGSSIVSTITPKRPLAPAKRATPFSFASKRAESMANSVNTMAQLVMAPCLAPNVDDMISGGANGSPRRHMNGSLNNGKIRVTSQFNRYGTSNENPFEPSSDAEEEGETKSIPPYLRGNQSCLKIPPLVFKPMGESDDSSTNVDHPYLYEMIVALWVQAWTNVAASMKSDTQVQGSSNTWPYELVQGSHNPTSDAVVAIAFIRHMSFFLPLLLKSLGLRCAQNNTTKLIVSMTFLDDNHMKIIVPLVETIALGLMREAMSGSSGIANSDQMLAKALTNGDCVLDFLVGIFSLLHPSQVAMLLLAYFNILEECEDPKRGRQAVESANKSHLRCRKSARQIRLHAVERLAAIPTFGRLNFPLKFTGSYPRKKVASSSWTNQSTSDVPEKDSFQQNWEKVERFPQAFWLSELLMNQCLSICNSSCKMIIIEANEQAKAAKLGKRRGGSALLRVDLLRIESLAFHSIVCAYELLIKRQAMDARFQTVASGTRVAALFTRAVLQQSVDAVSLLARMDPDQKVRLVWLLCFLYILQEGPDAMIRDELRRLWQDNRINDFVHLLKLASSSCQHFIPSDDSLQVLGGLSKEMTQEAFNCLSASVILLIDECFDVVSVDEHALEKLGGSLFDVLLHLLTTPQSSVTLLRTLGGSAHALDKFGALVFIKTAGNKLQHWGRIVLTMMNATELSVRSMAVDFLVTLLGGIYQECGSIETISLCILSVLPEVVAREIALFSASGLIHSMENAESSLWPLRRALADVEDTDPLDDDRVDQQLLPSLTTLCRTSQAIIDGVLVEIRLRDSAGLDLGEIAKAQRSAPTAGFRTGYLPPKTIFDADEESILEAASFFSRETSLVQKLRWLYTLRDLHVAKRQWSEVAESIFLCAHSLLESLNHLPNLWRPSRCDLWNDYRRSPWLSSVGSSDDHCRQGNVVVMDFANAFLEPDLFIHQKGQVLAHNHLSVEGVCLTLIFLMDQLEVAYVEEDGMEDLACSHFEELLSMITTAINSENKRYHTEARTALRRTRAHICTKLAKMTERDVGNGLAMNQVESKGAQIYVRVVLHGNKPERFKESTGVPTFFEWDMPSICRVSKPVLQAAARMKQQDPTESWEECICRTYAKPLIEALRDNDVEHKIILRTRGSQDTAAHETKTYISVMVVQKKSSIKSRKFFVRHGHDITEYTVAHKFPHALSRQRSLITSEIKMSGQK